MKTAERRTTCGAVLLAAWVATAGGWASDREATWLQVGETIYGAKPDEGGPIGGGEGYVNTVARGDYTVRTLDELLEALGKADPGQVVFIPGSIEIDLTARIYIDELVLEIPEGVTLASDRGLNGSRGARLISDTLKMSMMIRAVGPDVRITGLRIRGPNTKRFRDHHDRAFGPDGKGGKYYYKLPVCNGIMVYYPRLEVDNCDISGFSSSGVYLGSGDGHHVHHCYIHHCQHDGLGYGINHNTSVSLIEQNLFNRNRHSIAGTGRPGNSYVARNNVELGVSLSHCFDMHGGMNRKDGTSIAGTRIEITNNTFRAPEISIMISGKPEERCDVRRNWFLHHSTSDGAVVTSGKERIFIGDNAYGPEGRVEGR